MAKGNIRIYDPAGHNTMPTWEWQTEANATAILAGEPVKLKSAGSPYVIPLADAEPVIGTTTQVIGIAATDSTQTASADGKIKVYLPLPGVIYACKAKTAASFDTQSEIDALVGDNVLVDLTSSTYTIDQSAGNAGVNGVQIVGGLVDTKEVLFTIRPAATEGAIA